jgi:3-oxoacid CoA-transferase subunit B
LFATASRNCYLWIGVSYRPIRDISTTPQAVIDVTHDGLQLVELAPGVTVEEVRTKTEPDLQVRY